MRLFGLSRLSGLFRLSGLARLFRLFRLSGLVRRINPIDTFLGKTSSLSLFHMQTTIIITESSVLTPRSGLGGLPLVVLSVPRSALIPRA